MRITAPHRMAHTCHSASMASGLLGLTVEPGSLGFIPNTFFRQLSYSFPDPSPESLDHTAAVTRRVGARPCRCLFGRLARAFLWTVVCGFVPATADSLQQEQLTRGTSALDGDLDRNARRCKQRQGNEVIYGPTGRAWSPLREHQGQHTQPRNLEKRSSVRGRLGSTRQKRDSPSSTSVYDPVIGARIDRGVESDFDPNGSRTVAESCTICTSSQELGSTPSPKNGVPTRLFSRRISTA